MFAKGEIITLQKDSVIVIPKDIVNSRRGGNRIVYTVEQNRAMEKIITVVSVTIVSSRWKAV